MRSSFLVLLACASAACGSGMTRDEWFRHPVRGVTKRAAFELRCPEEQLVLTDLGDSTVGVAGCGQSTVYVHDQQAGTWLNDGGGVRKAEADAGTPPTPAP